MRPAFLVEPPDPPPSGALTGGQQVDSGDGCAWWNLACHGGTQVADSGMSALTSATAHGANQLLGEIVKTVDESTQVPLTDPTYQAIYTGFLGLAAPLLGIVLFAATMLAALRRDPATLGRAVTGLIVAGLGGALYLVMAQLLVGLDNWLAHGIVEVTGRDLTDGLTEMATGFERIAGLDGAVAANMLMLVLMLVMLLAGIILWFVLVLRQIAILVVVAFAPLLVAGYLWAPTRPWVRRATEVLIALVFTKTAIYALFGIGLALLSRGAQQSLSDFVGAVVLLCGACFTPLVMLRLVHFAADTQVAGEMLGTLRGGVQPVLNHLPSPGARHGVGGGHGSPSSGASLGGRGDLARQHAQGPTPEQPVAAAATTANVSGPVPTPTSAAGSTSSGSSGSSATGTPAAAAVGPTAALAAGAASAASTVGDAVRETPGVAATMAPPPRATQAPTSQAEPPLTGPPPVGPRPNDPPLRPEGDQP